MKHVVILLVIHNFRSDIIICNFKGIQLPLLCVTCYPLLPTLWMCWSDLRGCYQSQGEGSLPLLPPGGCLASCYPCSDGSRQYLWQREHKAPALIKRRPPLSLCDSHRLPYLPLHPISLFMSSVGQGGAIWCNVLWEEGQFLSDGRIQQIN